MSVAIVVSDTSPIRALHHLKRLDILSALYQDVWIPTAVLKELDVNYPNFRALIQVHLPFLKERAPSNAALVATLLRQLDPGESEAIALAIEIGADTLLMDELDGRTVAKQQGLHAVGVLGVLTRAKKAGLIGPLRPMFDTLQAELNFFMTNDLKNSVLKSVGE